MNNQQYDSSPARDMFKGAIIGAAVATAFAVLVNKDTREKLTKSVKSAIHDMKKKAAEVEDEAKDKYEKSARQMDEKFHKRETSVED